MYLNTLYVLLFHQCVEYIFFSPLSQVYSKYTLVCTIQIVHRSLLSSCGNFFFVVFFLSLCSACILTGRQLLERFWQGYARCRGFYSSKQWMLLFCRFFCPSFPSLQLDDTLRIALIFFTILFKRIESLFFSSFFRNVRWIVVVSVRLLCISSSWLGILFRSFSFLYSIEILHIEFANRNHKIWNAIIRNMMSGRSNNKKKTLNLLKWPTVNCIFTSGIHFTSWTASHRNRKSDKWKWKMCF